MRKFICLLVLLAVAAPVYAGAGFSQYYIGRDLRATIPTGNYAGLDNPNFNRLTLLYAHTYPADPSSNHYHAKGVFTYAGPNLGAGTAVVVSPSNFLPETGPPIQLLPGSGAFAGSFVSGLTPGVDFADLELRTVDSLAGYSVGSPESILFNSGGSAPVGRWTGSLVGSDLALQLVSATPGLKVTDTTGSTVLANPGDTWALGAGGPSFSVTPVLVASSPGLYSAVFRLIDRGTGNNGGPWGDSGLFQFNLAAVPEPGSLTLAGVGLGCVGLFAYRRRKHALASA